MTKHLLVTGGTGNIGSAIVAELISHNYKVSVLCRSEQSATAAVKLGADVVHGEIENPDIWLECINSIDGLIHTACGFGENMGAIDLQLMQAIVKKASQRDAPLPLIYTSGCWVYGDHTETITEESAKASLPEFQWMLDNIDYLKEQPTIDLRVVSPVNVVSEQEHYVPQIMLWDMEQAGNPVVPDVENLSWSLVDRKNLAALYRLAYEKGQHGEEYVGCDHPAADVVELATALSTQAVSKVPIKEWIERYGDWAGGYALKQRFSSAKASAELGWQPKAIALG